MISAVGRADVAALLAVAEAARDSLLSGAHDGDCDNGYRDEDGVWVDFYEPCSLHLAAAERRERALRAALALLPEPAV